MFTPIPANSHLSASNLNVEAIDYAGSLRESVGLDLLRSNIMAAPRNSKRDAASKNRTLARKAVRALKYGGFTA